MVELQDVGCVLIAPRRGQDAAMANALQARFGLAVPAMNAFTEAAGLTLARTAPHQLLAMRGGPGLFDALAEPLAEVAGVFDISDARTTVAVAGPDARERLRTLLPIDLGALQPGRCAQTVMAHLTVLVCQRDDAPTYELQCATSYRGSFLRAFALAGC